MQTLRHVVAGTDFSEGAEQALAMAIVLAVAAGAPITLVHACETCVADGHDPRALQCGEALARLVARHRHQPVLVTSVLRSGKPWAKLSNVAAEVGASLIVVGRHGAGRGLRVELGTVADQLIRTATRPVLTVPLDLDRLDTEPHEEATHREGT